MARNRTPEQTAKHRAYTKVWYETNKGKVLEQQRGYYQARRAGNPVYNMLAGAKARAKKRGWDYNLDPSDISIPEFCPVLGLPLSVAMGCKTASHNSPSIDRIDGKLGYIKGNIRVISYRANNLKSDATDEELTKILNYIRSPYVN